MHCLVEVDYTENYAYAALSYVWGAGKRLLLTNDTLQWLSMPNAFSYDNEMVPATFRGAISVAETLDIPYIWIDAICVQQDHEEQLAEHMDSMDSIYGSATLTIVSDTDSAWTGIPGINFLRPHSQTYLRHAGQEYIRTMMTFPQELSRSPWEKRAWCFQERVFSRRLLIFTPSQTFYHCKTVTWQEDMVLGTNEEAQEEVIIDDHISTLSRGLRYYIGEESASYYDPPTLLDAGRFLSAVAAYCGKHLSFETDILRAFNGILRYVESDLGPATWGMPVFLLARGLPWHVRDVPGVAAKATRFRRPGFPSWSWAAMKVVPSASARLQFYRSVSECAICSYCEIWKLEFFYHHAAEEGIYILKSANPLNHVIPKDQHNVHDGSQTQYTHRHQDPKNPAPQSSSTNVCEWKTRWSRWLLDDHPGEIGYESRPVPTLRHNPSTMPPLSQVLRFFTSVATLEIKQVLPDFVHSYDFYVPGADKPVGRIRPDQEWSESRNTAQFIYINREKDWTPGPYQRPPDEPPESPDDEPDDGRLILLMVEPIGDGEIMKRIGICNIRLNHWRCAQPTWKLVSLA
jgi:hypothetical protein